MPDRDRTGPKGDGPMTGRRGTGQAGFGGGPQGNCQCPACGHEQSHQAGVPCNQVMCSQCGTAMERI
ncbi:MAG: DUF5320 domain-containing protein [Methanosarcinaceae archaeon]|nr:DUF5320 domain-containing protein [Methanosarcinaceae archaeon]